ncbi:alpha-galactosidase [Paenibacillus sp. FSL R7-0273]|uniref:alpha-galactosidase n=1 Tax=Paenibacillus sp. FSL R7-0273 TaxID=1536772 RepID=UPI0004F67B23|nr:alpha-galactosidase [Paenibacillus sp. FSL R7-0273]AIQ45866.1 alpha-galactosidase [Paenibacillus sp. FSL R7-0273]OMF95424.1 alpha-galactosidase [Paenibacillus sp. FSL R7-0273]
MNIYVDESLGLFHLQSKDTSYIIQLVEGYPSHVYWGSRLRHDSSLTDALQLRERSSFSPNPVPGKPSLSLDALPQEYPQYGTSDFRRPAYQAQLADGSRITELKYTGYAISSGKPVLEGLPAVYAENDNEAQTLELTLKDDYAGLTVKLLYTVFANHSAIARSVHFEHNGTEPLRLEQALSASVDFADSSYDTLHLSGAWVRERHIQRRALVPGAAVSLESRRGSSSHQLNPFLALLRPGADEDHGDVFGFSLVYSGSFAAVAEVEQFGTTRVNIGINPFDFSWLLEPGQTFQTPEAILVYSGEGLGGMSRTYHRLYRTRLCRGVHRDQVRPILVNNWEATYFNFDADKITAIAKEAGPLGIELFVLDDGWFGKRDNDDSSLGDWFEHSRKLPGGLAELAGRVNDEGLQFGLWVEPEMVSPDSELYRKHPDWCLHAEGRRRTEARNQLILDLSRPEVCDYLYETLSAVFASAPITYVKWDMNRNMTEIVSAAAAPERQKETAHRYMLGLYNLMERLTSRFPDILFESCSGGGGRFDPGMLFYMPQTWTSDDTDAIERLAIQYGTSIVYPASSMGAHVSAVPNHQVERTTSLAIRGDVAMSGNFGYELDLTAFTEAEKSLAAQQIAQYKEIRSLVQQGDMYRLLSPFEGSGDTAWMFVSEDKTEAFVAYFRVLAKPNAPITRLTLKGLDPELDYVLETGAAGSTDSHGAADAAADSTAPFQPAFDGTPYGGDRLMRIGLVVSDLRGDFTSCTYRLRAVKR